ncbi:hypothetical protein PRIPAC_76416 [Pristionchus pacificus]|uniref:Dehydrogenase n=1 Tax=Pristionchus pacificus TaxID=54126 RepID=A0A2A6D0C7_PRIPA|nr:hypothetical protein PRIPAC_76416 [Pristionchus pacificus]|eukprot:PDM83820.1 dehydrogenase [Pristionchus pacificus]
MAASNFFQGKSIIVTGSSNGIGRETARMFAERGAKITITGRNAETLKKTKDLCLEAGAKEENILEVLQTYLSSSNSTHVSNHSSVGRAEDCRSLGHWFESGWLEFLLLHFPV